VSAGLLFDPEDGGSTFLHSVGKLVPDYTGLVSRRYYSVLVITVRSSNPTKRCLFFSFSFFYIAPGDIGHIFKLNTDNIRGSRIYLFFI
jgi:hypothetical protein